MLPSTLHGSLEKLSPGSENLSELNKSIQDWGKYTRSIDKKISHPWPLVIIRKQEQLLLSWSSCVFIASHCGSTLGLESCLFDTSVLEFSLFISQLRKALLIWIDANSEITHCKPSSLWYNIFFQDHFYRAQGFLPEVSLSSLTLEMKKQELGHNYTSVLLYCFMCDSFHPMWRWTCCYGFREKRDILIPFCYCLAFF